jgi:hypothetical protein
MGVAAKLAREKLLERREYLRDLSVLINTRTDRQCQIKLGSEPILGFTKSSASMIAIPPRLGDVICKYPKIKRQSHFGPCLRGECGKLQVRIL